MTAIEVRYSGRYREPVVYRYPTERAARYAYAAMSRPIISPTCEYLSGPGELCGRPTDYGYEVMGGGWVALCEYHAQPHHPYALVVAEIIARNGRYRSSAEYAEAWARRGVKLRGTVLDRMVAEVEARA